MDGVTIMLLPDKTYRDARPKTKEHHLTVAFYGPASQMRPVTRDRLQAIVNTVADRFGPIAGKANGVGVFYAGNDGFAIVDLIDGVGSHNVRVAVEEFDGLDKAKIDIRHGFTPHVTREYLTAEDAFYAEITPDMIDNIEFTFDTIALWWEHPTEGRYRYERTL